MKKLNIFGIVFLLMIGLVSANLTLVYDSTVGDADFTFDVVNLTINYVNGTASNITDTTLTQEEVEDYVGGMLDGTEIGINVTYNDTAGNINFIVTASGDYYFKNETYNSSFLDSLFDEKVDIIGDTMTGDLTLSSQNPRIDIVSNNGNGVSRLRVTDNNGEYISIGRTGDGFANPNTSSITNSDGDFNFLQLDQHDIVFLVSPTGLPQNSTANFKFTNDGKLEFDDPNKAIYVEEGDGLVLENLDNLSAGSIILKVVGTDPDSNILANAFWQNGKNNSFSGSMNTFGNYPKSWIINNTDTVVNYSSLSNYVSYCSYLQYLGLVSEGCKYFADTTGRLVPLMFAGDLEVHRTATIHEGLVVYNNLNYIDRGSNDVDLSWSTLDSTGKLHIRNQKQIQANLSEFDFTIADFDDGTILFFVSESVAPETGRDWRSVNAPECFNDRCGQAQAGNIKNMSFTGDTSFQGGSIVPTETNISFYITTNDFTALDEFYVEIKDLTGNITQLYSQTADVSNNFVNVAFPDFYLGKNNITTSFVLDGTYTGGSPTTVWIDEVKVHAIPNESIVINESYEGGKITLGDDGLGECYIEKDKIIDNATQSTEGRLKIVCDNVKIEGDIESATTTITEQNITGNSVINGNLTVLGNTNVNELFVGGGFGDTGATMYSNGDVFLDGDLFIGNDILNVVDVTANGSIIPYTNSVYDLGSITNKWNDLYVDGFSFLGDTEIVNLDVQQIDVNTTIEGMSGTQVIDFSTYNQVEISGGAGVSIWSDLYPHTDGTYDLGSSSEEWQDLYIDGYAYIDTLQVDSGNLLLGTGGELIVWDTGDSRFEFSDDIYAVGSLEGTTLNTGQGANELYAMNQDVESTDDVTFNNLQLTDALNITETHGSGSTLETMIEFGNVSIAINSTHMCMVGESKICIES